MLEGDDFDLPAIGKMLSAHWLALFQRAALSAASNGAFQRRGVIGVGTHTPLGGGWKPVGRGVGRRLEHRQASPSGATKTSRYRVFDGGPKLSFRIWLAFKCLFIAASKACLLTPCASECAANRAGA